MEILKNYINGKFTDPSGDNYLDCYEPATGKVYAQIPNSDKTDVARAIDSAKAAFPKWSDTTNTERYEILTAIADGIKANAKELAAAESKDNGKPLSLASKVDIPRAITNFQFFASAALQFSSESYENNGRAINYVLRQPLGVVGCISPWNLPLYLFTWKIAPALATGNTVVAKPSEVTPYTAYKLCEIAEKAGLPAGVLNVVHGLGHTVGNAITTSNDIEAVSFTGSTATGMAISQIVAPKFKKLSLEMGGKNANIIFADCNYDKMLETTLRSSFANQGQICLCGSRILIERSMYDKFKNDFVQTVRQLKVGDPKDPQTNLGAVVSKEHMDKILSYINLAKEEGGHILCGGNRKILDGEFAEGYYVEPTVIEGLPNTARCNQEEIFGPVVTLQAFDTEAEALALANGTDYGLAFSLWTENTSRALRLSNKLEAGIVWVNTWMLRDVRTPFGGVKNSGIGREGGLEAMRFFTEEKNVCIEYGN